MQFFEIVPGNFFNILSSASTNKELYIEALMVLYQEYKDANGIIKREECISALINHFEKRLFLFKEDEGKVIEEHNTRNYARYIMDRLIDTGWIDKEETVDFEDVNIIIPNYSHKFLNTISDIEQDKIALRRFTSSIYANLRTANGEKSSIYQYFDNAYNETMGLQDVLNSMYSNIKKSFSNLLQYNEPNELLKEALIKYGEKVAERYHFLKTDENILRYRSEILQILSDWEYDHSIINLMAKQLRQEKAFYESDDDAEGEILQLLGKIRDIFLNIDQTIDSIDKKNRQYVRTTSERVEYLLNQNRDFKGNLINIIKKIAISQNQEEDILFIGSRLPIYSVNTLLITSLYRPNKKREPFSPSPINIPVENEESHNKKEILHYYRKNINKSYTQSGILSFLERKFNGQKILNTKDITIENDEEFIQLIIAYKLSTSKNKIKYKADLYDGIISKGRYKIPEIIFTREE